MLLWITHSIYPIFSLIIQKYFIEIFLTVTSAILIKYHSPPSDLTSRRITENVLTHSLPGRDAVIESLLIKKGVYLEKKQLARFSTHKINFQLTKFTF